MDKYLENGKQIYEEHCSTTENQPTMLPRAPKQIYVDLYPDEDQPGPSFRDEKQHQSDYETEVKVYRALEEVDGNFIVLHSFKFTHHQYRLCAGGSHNREGCSKCKGKNAGNQEGECDFLIICADSFIVIEVKNMENIYGECTTDKLKALIGTYKKSIKQRNKVVELIRCIDKDAKILQFTAYPNFSNRFQSQFQCSDKTELRLSDDELSTIIFEEDVYNFLAWWEHNVIRSISSVRRSSKQTVSSTEIPIAVLNQDSYEKARNILLAIWATERNSCDKSKCSLGRCIVDINKQLKEGLITFETKKGKRRDQNPWVVKAPDVISNYIGVRNLTTQQNSVFNSSENLLWINGPAGAGKTVILCGKILQLLESDSDDKVVVFKFTGDGNNSQHYQNALNNASIEYKLISTSKQKHTPVQLADLINESLYSVVIVEITDYSDTTKLTDILSPLIGYHLFVDDIQTIIRSSTTAEKWTVFINKLLELSADKNVWIACDFAQVKYISDIRTILNLANSIIDILNPYQRATLSMNLRNTFDLSSILSVIRNQYVKVFSLESDILDLVLPTHSPGHFIHGPLPVIHVFNDCNVADIARVFNIELDRLSTTHELNYSDIGIVICNVTRSDVVALVMERDITASKIAVCNSYYSYSAEWPAVIVVCGVGKYNEENDLTRLYLMLSRARVYCSVFILPGKGRSTLDDTPYMLPLLDKLGNIARIIRH